MKTWKMIKDKIKGFLHEFLSEILFSSGIQSLKRRNDDKSSADIVNA